MSATVFISHSSRDKKVAQTLCEALEQRGLACWLSSRDIGPGENFQEAIVKALRGARAMILVFTANANNSDEIKKEMALASQNRLAVIPVRVEDVVPSDAFAYEFATRQWVDVFGDWDRAVGRLADQVREFVGDGAAPRIAALPPPRRARRRWLLAGAMGAAVLAAAAGGYAVLGLGGAEADVSGDWITAPLANPYDQTTKSVVTFELHQRGETLFGTVGETVAGRGGGDKKGIRSGQIKDGTITFFTQGMSTAGGGEQPYKEIYHGVVKDAEIDFIRQNDLPTGGLPEKFIATRK